MINLKRLYRRFFPAEQKSECSRCGRPLVETRRKPCPTCGSLSRTWLMSAEDFMQFKDKA